MFARWLKTNKVPSFSYSNKIIPTAKSRNFWESIPNDIKSELIEKAEGFVGYEFKIIKATDFMEFFRSGNRIIMEDKHFPRRQALCALALAECIEHKGRYLDELVNVIFMLCEETYWGLSAHMRAEKNIPSGIKPNLDLFAAETGSDLALVRYLLGDELTSHVPEIIERLDRELEARILTPFFTDYNLWWMGHEGKGVNNWCPWIISNVLTVLTYFETNVSRLNEGVKRCMDTLQLYVNDYPADGGCNEGPSYWTVACAALFDCIEQLYNMSGGEINFYGEPLLRSMLDYLEKVYIGGRNYVCFADSPAKLSSIAMPITYRFAKAVGNEKVAKLSAMQYQSGVYKITIDRDPRLRRILMSFMCVSDMLSEAQAPQLETEFLLDKTEVLTARENSTGNGFYLAAKGGTNSESHNHNDVGSYIIYYDNEPLIIDVGCSDYTRQTFSEERYDQFFTRSDWHNLPTVNGVCEGHHGSYRSSSFKCDIMPERIALDIGIETAYPEECGLDELNRSIVFDRQAPAITVSDGFKFRNNQNDITENIILLRQPEINENIITLFTEGGKRLRLTYDNDKYETNLVSQTTKGSRNLQASWGKNAELFKLEFKAKCGKAEVFEIKIDKF